MKYIGANTSLKNKWTAKFISAAKWLVNLTTEKSNHNDDRKHHELVNPRIHQFFKTDFRVIVIARRIKKKTITPMVEASSLRAR